MVHCEILRRKLATAILAGAPIPQDDSLARDGAIDAWHPPIRSEPYHARDRDVDFMCVDLVGGHVFYHSRALQHERQSPARGRDINWLVCGVQHEH